MLASLNLGAWFEGDPLTLRVRRTLTNKKLTLGNHPNSYDSNFAPLPNRHDLK